MSIMVMDTKQAKAINTMLPVSTDFSVYWVPILRSIWFDQDSVSPHLRFKGVPIGLLEEFKAQYKGRGFKIRKDAVSFSVYSYR